MRGLRGVVGAAAPSLTGVVVEAPYAAIAFGGGGSLLTPPRLFAR
jgi:hypothetical protein